MTAYANPTWNTTQAFAASAAASSCRADEELRTLGTITMVSFVLSSLIHRGIFGIISVILLLASLIIRGN